MIRSRQETRERILTATQRLLDRTSAQEFQIRDVAREASVSASLIIQYFNSKDELVFEAALRRLESMNGELAAVLEAAKPATLAELFEALMTRDVSAGHVIRDLMSLSWWWAVRDEQRIADAMQPRRAVLMAGLTALKAPATEDIIDTVMWCYFATLRIMLISKMPVAEAANLLAVRVAPMLTTSRSD